MGSRRSRQRHLQYWTERGRDRDGFILSYSKSTHILILSYSHTLIFSYSHTLIFSYSHTLIFSYSHILILSYSHILILSYSHILILSYSHTLIPKSTSYCHTLIFSYSHTQSPTWLTVRRCGSPCRLAGAGRRSPPLGRGKENTERTLLDHIAGSGDAG